eukprot:scaffold1730_cov35-Tisochrysis_lutea.AAC.5
MAVVLGVAGAIGRVARPESHARARPLLAGTVDLTADYDCSRWAGGLGGLPPRLRGGSRRRESSPPGLAFTL